MAKTYVYHELDLVPTYLRDIRSNTVIRLTALPSCTAFKTCWECTTQTTTGFECIWCPALKFCSSGLDRNRRAWERELCYLSKHSAKSPRSCPVELVQSNRHYYNQTIQVC